MKRFLHVGFNFQGKPLIDELKPTFDQAEDWLRYAPNCWILWTDQSPAVWNDRLRPFLRDDDNLFICGLDITRRQGWLPKSSWEWSRKIRTQAARRRVG